MFGPVGKGSGRVAIFQLFYQKVCWRFVKDTKTTLIQKINEKSVHRSYEFINIGNGPQLEGCIESLKNAWKDIICLVKKFQNQPGMKNEVKNEYFETYEVLWKQWKFGTGTQEGMKALC